MEHQWPVRAPGLLAQRSPWTTDRRAVRSPRAPSAALLAAAAAALALTGCQPAVDVSNAKVARRLPPAVETEIPLVTDEDERPIVPDAIKGKQVFDQNCAVCHGPTGEGNGPMAATLVAPDKDVLTAPLGRCTTSSARSATGWVETARGPGDARWRSGCGRGPDRRGRGSSPTPTTWSSETRAN